jgi:hypothetical protein
MLTIIDAFHAFQVFCVAWTAQVLMEDGQLLEKYRRWLEKKSFEWQDGWITKPMGLCARCFHGQAGLWSGLILFGGVSGISLFEAATKTIIFTSFNIVFFEIKGAIAAWIQK